MLFRSPSNLYNFQEFVWLTPSTERNGINTTFRYDLTPTISAYAETAYQINKSHIELAPSPISTAGDNNIIVPKTNYWNPFGVDVSFNFRPVDIGPRMADISNDSYRLVFGLKGSLQGNWQWDAYYSYDNDKVVDQTKNAISESRLRASLAKSTRGRARGFSKTNASLVRAMRGKSSSLNDLSISCGGTPVTRRRTPSRSIIGDLKAA